MIGYSKSIEHDLKLEIYDEFDTFKDYFWPDILKAEVRTRLYLDLNEHVCSLNNNTDGGEVYISPGRSSGVDVFQEVYLGILAMLPELQASNI